MLEHAKAGEKTFKGIPVSAGVCKGKVVVLRKEAPCIPDHQITEAEIPRELDRLQRALVETRQQILEVQRQVQTGLGGDHATIFDAHLLVLEDPILIEEVTRLIRKDRANAEAAFAQFSEKYAATLSRIDDEYLRERVADIRDVGERVLNNLAGRNSANLKDLKEPCIVIAEDLVPSQTAVLDRKMVLGFATEGGSKTSHTAIMARSMEIPAVVGLQEISTKLRDGDVVLLDGYNGLVIVNPTEQTLFEYGQIERRHVDLQARLGTLRDEVAITLDGVRITLSANVEQAADATAVKACGAEGVGLFRTEYLFLHREILPTEEEQYEAYRSVAAALKPAPVVIRTLDLGGDKFLSHLQIPQEMNPFLGWRAIRFCLQQTDIFRAQLRAILRASVEGNIKMMYPMISCLDELRQAHALVEQYKTELRCEKVPFNEELEIGVMIEIPSAAVAAETLGKKVKFFSIGTNDLIQYTLAVDRLNEKIAHLYQPTHPAILRLIKMTVEAGRKNKIWTGVCGEMAGDPVMVPLLLGLGVDELSAVPSVIPQIKFLIRNMKMEDARKLADHALQCDDGVEILKHAQDFVRNVAPSLFDSQS